MKLNEVIAKYGNQEVDESKIKEVLGVKESKVWKPDLKEKYWYVSVSGIVSSDTNDENEVDIRMYKFGNVFKTATEAEFARDKQIFLTKFERYLRENEDEPVDWENESQVKYSLYFECNSIEIAHWKSCWFQGSILTTSKLALYNFIKDNEADIKKYMFGVE